MRAPPLLLLLLMAATGLAVSPLARLNPWLSACDLEEGASAAPACGAAAGACGGGSGGAAQALQEVDVARLCALTAGARTRRLASLRLRVCCERSPASALAPGARADVAHGGARCESALRDLLHLDALVAQVHCDFVTILDRYDCDQPFSVHTCQECQETYRRWACSTMVPLWVEEGAEAEEEERGTRSVRGAGHWRARHLERVGHLDRRRAVNRWVRAAAAAAAGPGRPLKRLKPCLAVCQLVEQHCPYFLPADRAPAYPTQYAGEPTFLCLDARIPETGEQANKSNYGRDDCCYTYCEGRGQELCHQCETQLAEPEPPVIEQCAPVEERVPTCSVPYQAPASASRLIASPSHAVLVLTSALVALALGARAPRTHWTVPKPLINVRGSRL